MYRAAAWAVVIAAAAFAPLAACGTNNGSPGANETDASMGADGASSSGSGGNDAGGGGSSGSTTDGGSGRPSDGGSQDAALLDNPAIHYLGRFDTRDPAGPRFAWPGSAIALSFRGTGLQVGLTDHGTNYFAVSVDGQAATEMPTSGIGKTYTLASGLSAATHTVVLTKKTEAFVGIVQLLAVTPTGAGAMLVASPEPFSRRIEYVGEATTCGWGDLGTDAGCGFSPQTEDETVAYGALTATSLNAQQTVIAYSGKGIYRDSADAGTDQLPTLFERTLPDDPMSTWGFTTPPPDVVLINLGGNDFTAGDPGQPFVTAYVAFLHQLRGHYPQAQIVCALGPTLGTKRTMAATDSQNAVKQAQAGGDMRVQMLQIAEAEGGTAFGFDEQLGGIDGFGCAYHPSAKTHEIMAAKLTPVLKALLGW
jgi:lysophospholipase L1-like esterase